MALSARLRCDQATSEEVRFGPENAQLPHLGTFSKAAELCSFTGAAKALGLTQAAVSQRIRALEKNLDMSLFHRRAGRVLLTEGGHNLYTYATRILDLHREARKEITGHEPALAGELTIAVSSVPGEHLLPGLLAEFGRKYPHVRVRRPHPASTIAGRAAGSYSPSSATCSLATK